MEVEKRDYQIGIGRVDLLDVNGAFFTAIRELDRRIPGLPSGE